MSKTKVFVTEKDTAVIECPDCQLRRAVPVAQYKGKKLSMKVKCACSHVFEIELDFRKHYRKTSSLDGHYRNVNDENLNIEAHYQHHNSRTIVSHNQKKQLPVNCIIKNVSFSGVGIEVMGHHLITVGNQLLLIFKLDNRKQTLVNRKVTVKSVINNFIGAEFSDANEHSAELGFYLMP